MKLSAFIATALLCSSTAMANLAAATGNGEQLLYDVYLDGNKIGYHKITIRPEKSRKIVEIEAEFNVKFLLFTAYKYKHQTQEEWQDNCLVSIDSETNDNGKRYSVSGREQNGQFKVEIGETVQQLPACIKTFAYWDPNLLKASHLLNTQTGKFTPVDTRYLGTENIDMNGRTMNARHYRISSNEFDIDLWYSSDMEWLALSTATENGANLRYIRQ